MSHLKAHLETGWRRGGCNLSGEDEEGRNAKKEKRKKHTHRIEGTTCTSGSISHAKGAEGGS
jgi:hypothetical protein